MTIIRQYEELAAHVQARLVDIDVAIGKARFEAAQAYLPGLTAEQLQRAQHLTGFLGFERRDPIKAMQHERTVLDGTVRRIEADQRYIDRELLAGADGTLTTKLVQTGEHLAPFTSECHKYEQHEDFLELIQVKYDTPEFDEKWWQSSYWKHWAAGDRICSDMGVDDFGDDLLPPYLKAAEQRAFWQNEYNLLQNQIGTVHQLTKNHDDALARIPYLPALYLNQSQTFLGEYLEEADGGLLEKWLSERADGDRPTIIALRKLAGLKAKQQYLQELQTEGIKLSIEQLRQRAWKFARKTEKYLRSKHYWRQISDSELDRKFAQKYEKYQQRPAKLRKLVDRIVVYDDYDRFDLSNDPALWWFEMTKKKPPRQWASTRRWYDRRPSFQIEHDAWADDDATDEQPVPTGVALAAASRDLDEVGYLS
jgi:hypothetical protein